MVRVSKLNGTGVGNGILRALRHSELLLLVRKTNNTVLCSFSFRSMPVLKRLKTWRCVNFVPLENIETAQTDL